MSGFIVCMAGRKMPARMHITIGRLCVCFCSHILPYCAAVFYNIDCGNKMSLTTSMERSPRRYHIMQSQAPRFRSSAVEVPFGVYNLDTGRKKTLESVARDNRRFYSSAFQSKAPRFARPWTSPVDLTYEPERTKNSAPATFSKSVELSNIKYSILRSRYKRFPDKPIMSNAPDITYSVDTYPRETLATAVKNSPISYRCRHLTVCLIC